MAKLKTLFVKKYFKMFAHFILQLYHKVCTIIETKHDFPFINIRKVPREVLEALSAKCWKNPVKALRGVDFTKYALL